MLSKTERKIVTQSEQWRNLHKYKRQGLLGKTEYFKQYKNRYNKITIRERLGALIV